MEDICLECKNLAEVSCSCDNSLRFCSKDYLFIHKPTKGVHEPIELLINKEVDIESLVKIENKSDSVSNENNEAKDSEQEN